MVVVAFVAKLTRSLGCCNCSFELGDRIAATVAFRLVQLLICLVQDMRHRGVICRRQRFAGFLRRSRCKIALDFGQLFQQCGLFVFGKGRVVVALDVVKLFDAIK